MFLVSASLHRQDAWRQPGRRPARRRAGGQFAHSCAGRTARTPPARQCHQGPNGWPLDSFDKLPSTPASSRRGGPAPREQARKRRSSAGFLYARMASSVWPDASKDSALFRRDDSESEQAEKRRTAAINADCPMRLIITERITIELQVCLTESVLEVTQRRVPVLTFSHPRASGWTNQARFYCCRFGRNATLWQLKI